MFLVYIMAVLEAGKEDEVLNSLKSNKQVGKASLTYGVYDLCVQAEFTTMEELNDFVFTTLRKIDGVKQTVTLISSKTIIVKPDSVVSFG